MRSFDSLSQHTPLFTKQVRYGYCTVIRSGPGPDWKPTNEAAEADDLVKGCIMLSISVLSTF